MNLFLITLNNFPKENLKTILKNDEITLLSQSTTDYYRYYYIYYRYRVRFVLIVPARDYGQLYQPFFG